MSIVVTSKRWPYAPVDPRRPVPSQQLQTQEGLEELDAARQQRQQELLQSEEQNKRQQANQRYFEELSKKRPSQVQRVQEQADQQKRQQREEMWNARRANPEYQKQVKDQMDFLKWRRENPETETYGERNPTPPPPPQSPQPPQQPNNRAVKDILSEAGITEQDYIGYYSGQPAEHIKASWNTVVNMDKPNNVDTISRIIKDITEAKQRNSAPVSPNIPTGPPSGPDNKSVEDPNMSKNVSAQGTPAPGTPGVPGPGPGPGPGPAPAPPGTPAPGTPPPGTPARGALPRTKASQEWVEYVASKDPSLPKDQVLQWVSSGQPWDPSDPTSTFANFRTQHQGEFDEWKKGIQQQQDKVQQQIKDREFNTLIGGYGGGAKFQNMQNIANVVKQLRERGWSDEMIARWNPTVGRAMQDYGLGGGGMSPQQLQNKQREQYWNQNAGGGIPGWLRRNLWDPFVRGLGGQGEAERAYRGQYAKSKRPILTAYDGSLLRKIADGQLPVATLPQKKKPLLDPTQPDPTEQPSVQAAPATPAKPAKPGIGSTLGGIVGGVATENPLGAAVGSEVGSKIEQRIRDRLQQRKQQQTLNAYSGSLMSKLG